MSLDHLLNTFKKSCHCTKQSRSRHRQAVSAAASAVDACRSSIPHNSSLVTYNYNHYLLMNELKPEKSNPLWNPTEEFKEVSLLYPQHMQCDKLRLNCKAATGYIRGYKNYGSSTGRASMCYSNVALMEIYVIEMSDGSRLF